MGSTRTTLATKRRQCRKGLATALLLTAACTAPAQSRTQSTRSPAPLPVVHLAIAARSQLGSANAVAWLRDEVLVQRTEWPRGRDAEQPFTVHVDPSGIRFGDGIALPEGCIAAGEASLDGTTIAFDCRRDGSETWTVTGARVPSAARSLLAVLRLTTDGVPRAFDTNAMVGHLAGAAVADDAAMQTLTAGALLCGEAVVVVTKNGSTLRVDGRSGGGLCVPAFVLWTAQQRDAATPVSDALSQWQVRAFAGRDGDRLEAVRQMQRSGGASVPALRAMLHGDETSRLCAMDGLVRLKAASELPRIVAAADASMPLASAMASTAVDLLWPLAAADTRALTIQALDSNPAAASATERGGEPAIDTRWRWLCILAVTLASLSSFWLRERSRIA